MIRIRKSKDRQGFKKMKIIKKKKNNNNKGMSEQYQNLNFEIVQAEAKSIKQTHISMTVYSPVSVQTLQ